MLCEISMWEQYTQDAVWDNVHPQANVEVSRIDGIYNASSLIEWHLCIEAHSSLCCLGNNHSTAGFNGSGSPPGKAESAERMKS